MPVYDTGFKLAAHTSAPGLAEAAGLVCTNWRAIVSEVQVTERFADRAFRATHNGERCIVYFEGYIQWRQKFLWNVLAKAGMLSERETLPTLTILYILRPRGDKKLSGTFELRVGGQRTQSLWYLPVPVWQLKPKDWWRSAPGRMTLFPLTDHGMRAKQAVQHAADVLRDTVVEPELQVNLLASLASFGELAYPGLDFALFIGREAMRRSSFIRRLFSEEFDEQDRKRIREALEVRFGEEVAASLTPLFAGITDEWEFARLHRLAISCKNPDEFRAGVSAKAKPKSKKR